MPVASTATQTGRASQIHAALPEAAGRGAVRAEAAGRAVRAGAGRAAVPDSGATAMPRGPLPPTWISS